MALDDLLVLLAHTLLGSAQTSTSKRGSSGSCDPCSCCLTLDVFYQNFETVLHSCPAAEWRARVMRFSGFTNISLLLL